MVHKVVLHHVAFKDRPSNDRVHRGTCVAHRFKQQSHSPPVLVREDELGPTLLLDHFLLLLPFPSPRVESVNI